MNTTTTPKLSECECCSKMAVLVMRNKMAMCPDCIGQEDKAMVVKADAIIAQAHVVDASIQVKMDVFNATTVASADIRASIENNPAIAADQKDYAMAQEMLARFKHMQQVVFETRQALIDRETEMRAYQTLTQTYAGKLRTELKDQFKSFDVSYQPVQVKTPKAKSTSSSSKASSFKKSELNDACVKYGVDATLVRMTMIQKNINADVAAQQVARSLGLLK